MRYFIFYNNGQVEAMQSSANEPSPTAWEIDRGYTRLEVTVDEFRQIDRDKRITVSGGALDSITPSVNSVQPEVDPGVAILRDLGTKISAETATIAEIMQYIAARDGLS